MSEPVTGADMRVEYSRAHPYLKNKRIHMCAADMPECPLCRDVEPERRETVGRTLTKEEAGVQVWTVEILCGDCKRAYTVEETHTKVSAGPTLKGPGTNSADAGASTSHAQPTDPVPATTTPSEHVPPAPTLERHAQSMPTEHAEAGAGVPRQPAKAPGPTTDAPEPVSWGIPQGFRRVTSPGNYQADTHTASGVTPRGLSWTASASHCRDLEDDDRSWSLQLGRMRVGQSDDCGRDWASASTYVSHPNFGTVSSADGRCRDPSQNTPEAEKGSRAAASLAIDEIAAHEGISADEVVSQLGYFAGIVRRFL